MRPLSSRHLALGQAIRGVRIAQGLSQEETAYRCGLDRSYFGAIERGEKNITVGNLWKVAEGVAVSASELLREADNGGVAAWVRRYDSS